MKAMDLFKKHPKVVLEKMLKATGQISKQHNTESSCVWGNGQDDLISVNYHPAQRKKSLRNSDYKKSRCRK